MGIAPNGDLTDTDAELWRYYTTHYLMSDRRIYTDLLIPYYMDLSRVSALTT